METIKLFDVMAPQFKPVHRDVKRGRHTHYWLKGGRGSTKSSYISLEIIFSIIRDGAAGNYTNAIVLRRYGVTIRESVYEQLVWAIDVLKVKHLWQAGVSPMQLTYLPTGQKVIFRGVDDATKIKSVKVSKGYIKYIWYEEANEFEGPEKIRSINQSVMRGGKQFTVFYSYNPPKAARNWVNQYVAIERPDTLVHHSTYLDVPTEWLGEQFISEAEQLKATKPEAYSHEYLGEVTGTGGEVFNNVILRKITDDEIKSFDRICRGLDWGYGPDPFVYVALHYDKKRSRILIYHEFYKFRAKFDEIAAQIKLENKLYEPVTAESAEPRSNDELKDRGIRITAAKKGPGSVEHGISWLQNLTEIVIDPNRCPETAREFTGYELERDREGNFKSGFPDKDNHTIDAVRYACEKYSKGKAISFD